MKNIRLTQMEVTYFKGVKSLSVNFAKTETSVFGDNATGKTTIFDAFTWALFGKDSMGRTAFEIKTLDQDNNVIPKVDHTVKVVLDVDGKEVVISRTLREKWVKKRGTETPVFTGHDTIYEWDGVPVQAGEFNSKRDMLIAEESFKIITNPLHFASKPWKERREALLHIVGGIDYYNVLEEATDEDRRSLEELIGDENPVEFDMEFTKKSIKAKITTIKKELSGIPARIDELGRMCAENEDDFDSIREQIEVLRDQVDQLNSSISNESAILEQDQEIIDKHFEIKKKLGTLEVHIKREHDAFEFAKLSELAKAERELRVTLGMIENHRGDIKILKQKIRDLEKQRETIREEWAAVNRWVYDIPETGGMCTTCGQEIPLDDKKNKQLEKEWLDRKKTKLAGLAMEGKFRTDQIDIDQQTLNEFEGGLAELETEKTELTKKIEQEKKKMEEKDTKTLQQRFDEDEDWVSLSKRLEESEKAMSEMESRPDTSQLETERDAVLAEIEALNKELAKEQTIKASSSRIDELADQESKLASEVASLERFEFAIENFERLKDAVLERMVNEKFNMARFKMYEEQINGGIKPTCEILYKGVPFNDLNNAAQINVGIDIINTICRHVETTAPIFIDNREAVTKLTETESQVVNLVVAAGCDKLVTGKIEDFATGVSTNII